MLTHELNKSWKLLLRTVETGLSGFRNQTLQFCRDQRQSGALPGFDEWLVLGVWMVERQEPWHLKELMWRLRDLIEENNEKNKTRAKHKLYLF
jgi:predicted GTPase